MGVRNKSEILCVPWIEPKILRGQEKAALIAHVDHTKNLRGWGGWETVEIDSTGAGVLIEAMRFPLLALLFAAACANAKDAASSNASRLPVVQDSNFEFRKAKLFSLTDDIPKGQSRSSADNLKNLTQKGSLKRNQAVTQDASLTFERSYRLHGAVTALDIRQRQGQYFDFFWRSKQPADVTVRFEYKQENLREFVQAKELSYRGARGTNESEFTVLGDEYFDDGRVLAWRCLLISNGRIVAEKRSFMW